MSKRLISLLLAVAFAWSALAQEDETAPEDPAAEVETADAAAEETGGTAEVEDADDGVLDEAFDDETLDEQTYEDDDDDFVPTEEIPADEPIPFPSNI